MTAILMKLQSLCFALSALALAFGAVGGLGQNAGENASLSSIAKMLPAGFVSRHVTVPTFNQDGRKASQFYTETLVRIDEVRLKAGETVIEIFAENQKQDLRLQMPTAYYHLNDKLLRSDGRCQVLRADMQTQGDSLIFDTETSMGSMVGKVRTLIFQTEKDTPKPSNKVSDK
jgi:hypothetical protein